MRRLVSIRQTAGAPRGGACASDPPRSHLTDREKEILRLVCDGLTNAEIAARLKISPETVKSGLKGIFRKVDVNNRTQAAVALVRQDLREDSARAPELPLDPPRP